jgi:hypothetical protein
LAILYPQIDGIAVERRSERCFTLFVHNTRLLFYRLASDKKYLECISFTCCEGIDFRISLFSRHENKQICDISGEFGFSVAICEKAQIKFVKKISAHSEKFRSTDR